MTDPLAAFDYELPSNAIAQEPIEPRDAARLLVVDGPGPPQHRHVRDLASLLEPGDLLVANDTAVFGARLTLRKRSGGAAEVLLLEPVAEPAEAGAGWWRALVKPSRRLADGAELTSRADPELVVTVGPPGDETRLVHLRVGDECVVDAKAASRLLARSAVVPLPPYIEPKPLAHGTHRERYQTVYARDVGSAAAPTAGLHFTQRLLAQLADARIGWATVTLAVGLDTFKPITGDPAHHVMHTERFRVPEATWRACETAKRVIAVGTTSVRTLETVARTGQLSGRTDLFLKPGDQFLAVDGMLTNFHLPRSSLLLLLAAFVGDRWRELYDEALSARYRFLSYGDAMLLLNPRRS